MTRHTGAASLVRIVVFLTAVTLAPFAAMAAEGPAQQRPVNPHAAALAEFQGRLQTYLELRSTLEGKLQALVTTTNAAELASRQKSLAEAMRVSRANATQGDLVPTAAADIIRETVKHYLASQSNPKQHAVLKEVPNSAPTINAMFPANLALPTMPPILLSRLPRLPDNLQYRFYGRHVALVDGDLEMIADYVPNVLPPH